MCYVLCLKRKAMSERNKQHTEQKMWPFTGRDNKKSMTVTTFYVSTAYIDCLLQGM